jgi:Glycosyl transferase family 2
MDNDSNITAIVNVFRRGHVLDDQIAAIRSQTLPPKSIMIWNNGNQTIDLTKYKSDPFFKVFDNNFNSGVWSRFLISQIADTDYICVFDDDTIPGENWFKNCMDCMTKKEALYGTIGVIFRNTGRYDVLKRYGWDGNCDEPMPVDIVGHSWFFKKSWISILVRELPRCMEFINVGEDITFSYMLQKYANIPTYVPPHPMNDLSMFGSIPKTAWQYGNDGNNGSHSSGFDKSLASMLSDGFRILINRQNATSEEDLQLFLDKIRRHDNFALIRPSDGEYNILQNSSLTNIDNWTFTTNGKLYSDLTNAVELASNRNCFVGIPCGCCNMNMAKWYISRFQLHPSYTTFANIFVNKNWKTWVDFLVNEKIAFHFIGPHTLPPQFFVQNYYHIPQFLVNDWDTKGDEYLTNILSQIKKYKNQVFLVSGGPIAKVIIAHAWNEHPFNIYLDIGSSLDKFMKGFSNREYVRDGSQFSNLVCKFDPNVITI